MACAHLVLLGSLFFMAELASGAPAVRLRGVVDSTESDRSNHREHPASGEEKTVMDQIHLMRVELCWLRPNLLQHYECLEYLGHSCLTHTSGVGICKDFTEVANEGCREKTGFHEELCKFADESVRSTSSPIPVTEHETQSPRVPRDLGEWLDNDDESDPVSDTVNEDRDGDGVKNEKDAFPDNWREEADRDGDGIGDAADAYPNNPDCYSSELPCPSGQAAMPPPQRDDTDPGHLNKQVRKPGLPPQGYDEYYPGIRVHHDDKTHTGDWRDEWPRNGETEAEAMRRICAKHPDSTWCDRYKEKDMFTR